MFANKYNLKPPRAYSWLLDHGLIGCAPSTQLEPWYHLPEDQVFLVNERWPKGAGPTLVAFARRQDTDDFACFSLDKEDVVGVAVIHGWTKDGYEMVAEYSTMWDWMKSAIDDIAELVDDQ
jgi:hypothetical protein